MTRKIDEDPRNIILELRIDIGALLIRRGVSQNQLADMLGVSRPYVSKLMTGEVKLPLQFVAAVCGVLGADLTLTPADLDWEDWKRGKKK